MLPSGVVALSKLQARPRDGGCFPGPPRMSGSCGIPKEFMKKYSTTPRFFKAGWVVSKWRSRWFSAPPSSVILLEVHEELTRSWKAPFLLAKDAIEPVPPADMGSGFSALTSLCPRKVVDYDRSWIWEVWTLYFTNWRLTQKRIFGCVRPLDWFAAIDLKDPYFHVSILPRHRPFLSPSRGWPTG